MVLKKKYIIPGALTLVVLIGGIAFLKNAFSGTDHDLYTVKRINFEEVIKCKGEINSAKAVEINMPDILQDNSLRLGSFRILNIVEEGKTVKKGDFVAQLDQSQIMTQMRTVSQDLERITSDLKNAKIDSTVKLTQLREEIIDANLDLEYNKIDLEQSVFESEAYQRKIKMNYEKAQIAIGQKKREYQLEKNKLKIGIIRLENQVEQKTVMLDKFKKALSSCTITSPGNGIIMLAKNPLEGKKYKRDNYLYSFMPLIAVLPNLDTANSEVYVKEIDISKVNLGDSARITFDALEGVTLGGKVTWINSMGEDHKDFDMKVFKVYIWLEQTDPGLKPAMSSNNEILVSSLEKVLTVPVNAVFKSGNDKYVLLKEGSKTIRQNVTTGPENEESVVITDGLKEGDQVVLEMAEEKALSQI